MWVCVCVRERERVCVQMLFWLDETEGVFNLSSIKQAVCVCVCVCEALLSIRPTDSINMVSVYTYKYTFTIYLHTLQIHMKYIVI